MSDQFHHARAIAKDFIRHYVERGDSYEHLKESWMGHWGKNYRAGIGVSGGWDTCRPRRGADALVISRIRDVDVCYEFSLRELCDEIREGREQLALF